MTPSGGAFVDFAAIKQAVSIKQILEHYGLTEQLSQKGDSLMGACPVHKGHNRTQFRVSLSKNAWNCFSCKGGGNILDLVSAMEQVNIREAALLIQEWFDLNAVPAPKRAQSKPTPASTSKPAGARQDRAGQKKRTEIPAAAAATAQEEPLVNKPLQFSLNQLDLAHPYLAERGLSKGTIAKFGLGFCQKGIMGGRIAIPIHDETGQLIGYAGRWPGKPPEETPKYKLPPGFHKALVLFNLHRVKQHWNEGGIADHDKSLTVVEGFFDCIKLWQGGLRNVVAVMGSALSEPQTALLKESVGAEGRIALLFDADEAGQQGSSDALEKLASHAYVKIIDLRLARTAAGIMATCLQPDDLSPDEVAGLL